MPADHRVYSYTIRVRVQRPGVEGFEIREHLSAETAPTLAIAEARRQLLIDPTLTTDWYVSAAHELEPRDAEAWLRHHARTDRGLAVVAIGNHSHADGE